MNVPAQIHSDVAKAEENNWAKNIYSQAVLYS